MVIPGTTTRFYQADQNAKYKVIVNNGGCIDTSDEYNFINAGITNGIKKTISVNVYPNPSSGIVVLDLNVSTPAQYNIEITDASGKRIYYEDLGTINSEAHKMLDLSSKARGVYFLNIRDQDGNVQKQIISIQ